MNAGWRETTIGAEVTLQRGFDITKKQQRPGNVPVVSSSGISSYHDTYQVKGPGVVIGRKGALGTVFYLERDFWPHDTTLWVKDFHENNPKFVYYFFKTLNLKYLDVGSANPTLNRNHVHPIKTLWPPLSVQRRIAQILGRLDDKIEVNRRINHTLEAMAQALFKHWFVDFGLFQDGPFVESELGLMPEGWEATTVGSVGEVVSGGTPSTKNEEYWELGNIHWATPSDMTALSSPVIFDTERKITTLGLENSSARLLPAGSVLVTSWATLGIAAINYVPMATN